MTGTTEDGGASTSTFQIFKYIYSSILLIWCGVLIIGLVLTEQTELAHLTHPVVAFFFLLVSICWLTMVEGGQGAIVGLGPVDGDLYKQTHRVVYVCTTTVHKGDNLDRYLLGRQFMVIVIVFTVELAGAPSGDVELWGLPDWITNLFLASGLAMILFTCSYGWSTQLGDQWLPLHA
jgi:hypothetical protein